MTILFYEAGDGTVPENLNIAEQFYSIQGEGPTSGVPSYFIRLKGCNLMCGGTQGQLVRDGKASWWCDTEEVWKQGRKVPYEAVVNQMRDVGQLERILDGRTHIIWSGGEPTIPFHRRDILGFLRYMHKQYENNNIFNEIETNGTFEMSPYFLRSLHQINCSPKLSNSGMPARRRINPSAILQIRDHENPNFKFVITGEHDVREARLTYIGPFEIPEKRVIFMPGVDKLADLPERTRMVMELCKQYGYRASTRLQVLGWDRTCGV